MINRDKIEAIVEEKIAGTAIYIVDVSVSTSNKIVVLVDTDAGITVEECINISRHIESSLDREVEDFELEVSSPGLSQPFKVFRQYVKNTGREVAIVTNDNRKMKGKLLSANEDGIELETLVVKKNEKKKKVSEKIVIQLGFDQIKSTKVVISF
jgi:ribosome maturation factor RimP